jgi:hypothetical protein
LTVPATGQTVKMTNNGTALVSPITPGYAATVSAVGREYVLSTEDGDKTAITFHEIIRYDPTTFKGAGILIAVFDRNATGMLAPFNGMIVVGTYFEDPNVRAATRIVFFDSLEDIQRFVNSVSRPEINAFYYQKAISDEFIYLLPRQRIRRGQLIIVKLQCLTKTRQPRDKLMQVIPFGLGYKSSIP